MPYADNKGADQPALPRSLISTFVVRCLDSIISLLAIAEISRPYLVSVAESAGLSLTWSQTPKTGFLVTWLKYMYTVFIYLDSKITTLMIFFFISRMILHRLLYLVHNNTVMMLLLIYWDRQSCMCTVSHHFIIPVKNFRLRINEPSSVRKYPYLHFFFRKISNLVSLYMPAIYKLISHHYLMSFLHRVAIWCVKFTLFLILCDVILIHVITWQPVGVARSDVRPPGMQMVAG